MDADCPKLRPLEATLAQDNMICLRDPMGISDKVIFLPHNVFFILSMFDGKNSILDIQTAYTRRYGDLLFSDKVRQIIEKLDSCLFLENSHFQEARDRVIEAYRETPVRAASHAGVSYEKDKKALMGQLEELFSSQEGPGSPAVESPTGRLKGLIAPHIDIKRGGSCFASSYAELARECTATTFVILGISHAQTRRRFVLTDRDFDTPLGVVPADRDFIESMTKKLNTDFFEDELVHRSEHSVEFQVLFLRYIYRGHSDVRIVPILCSSQDEIYAGYSPGDTPEFQEFTAALKAILQERGNQACCIAGVDLSHLGQRFGQTISMTPYLLKQAQEEDMNMIQRILDLDAEGFFRLIQEEKDRRNVCGVPAIYTLLKLIDARTSRLLKYDQSVEHNTQSVVTFMSAAFYA